MAAAAFGVAAAVGVLSAQRPTVVVQTSSSNADITCTGCEIAGAPMRETIVKR
jgi:hypothetical protein